MSGSSFHGLLASEASGPVAPSIRDVNTSAITTNSQPSHTVTLPAYNTGDLLFIIYTVSSVSSRTVTTPAGWTVLLNQIGGSDLRRCMVFYQVASGSSGGGATVSITASGNCTPAAVTASIKDWSGTPEIAFAAAATSTAPNPPSITPSWTAPTLYLALAFAHTSSSMTATGYPAGYSNTAQGSNTSGSSFPVAGFAANANLAGGAQDPGAFTLSTSASHLAATIAINAA